MDPFEMLCSETTALLAANVDTDIITPMKRLTGGNQRPLADYAFEAWRYDTGDADTGEELADFPLHGRGESRILLTGDNFGCGSSRESAPRALYDLGFRCLIGPSFGDIFFNNCFQLGILPLVVSAEVVEDLNEWPGEVLVDLEAERLRWGNESLAFEVNPLRRRCLLEGVDDIEMTLSREAEIDAYQERDRKLRPWVYEMASGSK